MMSKSVNNALKDHKIALPITKEGIVRLFKALNLHCTEMTAYEALLYCRGKQMESGPEDAFDFDKMIKFINMKSKIVTPANNPRIAL